MIRKPYNPARRPRRVGESEGAWRHDKHHCRCYSVDKDEVWLLRDRLRDLGFERQIIEEGHGQVWGLRLKTSETEQMHIKARSDGRIESEMEPQPEYPFAHINQEHSYSPHPELGRLLRALSIGFQRVRDVPSTCRRIAAVRPKDPINWKEIAVGGGIAAAGIGLVAYLLWKRRS